MLTAEQRQEIEDSAAGYPDKRAASVEALKVVQKHHGWVSDEHLESIARQLGISPAELDGVATFYNLIFRRPVGRHVILVCDSVSCWMLGYESLVARIGERLGIGLGETTADGQFTLLPTCCLGACDGAPVLMIDDALVRSADAARLDEFLARCR
jgi:NADH-quinone oxidoreductase subunit E